MSGYYAISEGLKKVKFHEKKKRETGTSARAHMMEVALVSLEADLFKNWLKHGRTNFGFLIDKFLPLFIFKFWKHNKTTNLTLFSR